MAVAELAARQHGVISLEQLTELGLSRRAVSRRAVNGRLHRVHPGVYAVGYRRLTPDGGRLAAVLALGPGAVLSHRAAADAWGIRGGEMLREVTTPLRRTGPPGVVVHRTRRLGPRDVTTLRGIPVTNVARTLVDLAGVLDPQRLATAVHEAEVHRLLDVRAVLAGLDRLPGRRGTSELRACLAVPAPGPTTGAFVEAFLALCAAAAIPPPALGVFVDVGHRLVEVDALFNRERVVVELDGEAVHRTRKRFQSDRRRDAELAAIGFVVLRFTWQQVTAGRQQSARLLRRTLELRR